MNLEIFNQPDPSGKMCREKYLIKNLPDEYNFILKYCIDNNLLDIPFKEKVYLCVNNITILPNCKNEKCSKKVNFKNTTIGYLEYCSIKCISSDPNIKKAKEEKSILKYGTKSPTQSREIKDKIIQTNQNRYGHNSAMCLVEVQEKSKQTLFDNHGVYNPSKSKDLSDKRIESFKKSNFKESFKKSSNEKYGVNHPWMNKEIHQKSTDSSRDTKDIITEVLIKDKMKNYPNHKLLEID